MRFGHRPPRGVEATRHQQRPEGGDVLALPVPHNSFAELRPADSQGMETRNQVGQSLRGDFAHLQRLLASEVFANADAERTWYGLAISGS